MTQYHDMTLSEVRSKLSGFHFSKESLTSGEREILALAERCLSEIDALNWTGYAQEFKWEYSWDKTRDQNEKCKCGHTYYRHFDSYENMEPVGCKYCPCYRFKEN